MICKKLHIMKRDEAGGILDYNKIKNEMADGSVHQKHIDTIEKIIGDEYDHLQEVEEIIKEMGCPELKPNEEIMLISHQIYGLANEIEKIAKEMKNAKLHQLSEELEATVRKIGETVS